MPAPKPPRTGTVKAAGGRVLTICATGPDVPHARETAYNRRSTPSSGRTAFAAATSPPKSNEHNRRTSAATRIAKFLSRAGVASRRDAERLLTEGVIRLNGKTVTHPATFIAPGDIVQVNGRVVGQPDRTRVWRYHKPEGLVTTHKDP